MKATPVLLAALMLGVGMAGCTESDGASVDSSTGAIAGLLVDDRFRPLQLMDDPVSDFQATGFVLLQELGLETQTNANGEFSFEDLAPGTYTLRVSADGHEAPAQQITVEGGLIAETTLIARRISSVGGSIVTEEYTGFAACSPAVIATSAITNCIDTSGESDRRGTRMNFTGLDDVTYMVMEIRVDEPGYWIVEVSGISGSEARSPQYGTVATGGDTYGKRIYEFNGTYGDLNPNPWRNDQHVRTLMFFQGDLLAPGESPTCAEVGEGCQGLGMAIGKRVRMLASVFVGEPEIDLETYEVLAADAT